MKKRIVAMGILLLFACANIAGCSSSSNTEKLKSNNGVDGTGQNVRGSISGQENGDSSGKTEGSNSASDGQEALYMIQKSGEPESNCSTEDGYYYLTEDTEELKDGSYGMHLMYMDYATRQEIYLCNSSGCKHDSASCPSVFLYDGLGSCSLFIHENYLYLFSQTDYSGATFISSDGSLGVSQEPACLYRMNLDGTGREKVVSFDEDVTLEDVIIGGKDALYFVQKKTEMKQMESGESYYTTLDRMLVKVDTETWDVSEQCKLEDESSIKGCSGNQLVCVDTVYEHEPTKEELNSDDAWKELYQKSRTTFSLLNPEDGSSSEIVSVSNDKENSWDVGNGMIYLSEEDKPEIRVIDLETGEERTVASQENTNIFKAFDDVICCSSWGMDDHTLYFVHPDTGKIDHCKLVNRSLGWSLEIKAETKNDFLVIYDYDATANGDDSYEIHKYQYGLISKEDLYVGNDQIQPINMIGKGM